MFRRSIQTFRVARLSGRHYLVVTARRRGQMMIRETRQTPSRKCATAAVLLAATLSTATACGGASSSSSDQIARDAKAVMRADLKPGGTGATAARISQELIRLDGVWGTHGDSGHHVWVYSTTDATPGQVLAIRRRLGQLTSVLSVTQLR